jgi:hypothetical protein
MNFLSLIEPSPTDSLGSQQIDAERYDYDDNENNSNNNNNNNNNNNKVLVLPLSSHCRRVAN